jgi:Coenzyme PQQ synthesis protein D (PqqD)
MTQSARQLPGYRPRQLEGVRLERRAGKPVLSDPARSRTLVLNESALALWELCDGETTLDEMTAAICEASAIPAGQADADVRSTLEKLDSAGLLCWET